MNIEEAVVWIKNNKAAPLASNTVQSKVSEFCLSVDRTQRAHGHYRDHLVGQLALSLKTLVEPAWLWFFPRYEIEKRLRAVYKTLHSIDFFKETTKKIQVETKRVPQGHLGGSLDAYRPLSLSLLHTNSHNWAQLCSALITLFYPSCTLCKVYFWAIQRWSETKA